MDIELTPIKQSIPYSIKLSKRAKRMRIAVYSDSSVILTLPFGFGQLRARKFLMQKHRWILKNLNYFKQFANRKKFKSGKREYVKYKDKAVSVAKTKVRQWNKFYGFAPNRVNIKNQKTRWGSCSKKGNLNFNYKIVHLPEHLLDYLVVHELCHLKEFNHSRNFWFLVSGAIPNYIQARNELKNFGISAS